MSESEPSGGGLRRAAPRPIVIVLVLAVVVGLVLAPFAFRLGAGSPESVAVVPLAGTIDGPNANDVSQRLIEARQDPSIGAAVVVVNSEGGLATASQELYMQMHRTAEEMPVVAVIDGGGLSGAYYAAVGADYVYAKPAANVGSVGTILIPPQQAPPIDGVIATGPNKVAGDTRRGWEAQVSSSTDAFAGAVMAERGDALELSEAQLREASIYTGADAVEYGLADEAGDLTQAVQHAASLADLGDGEYTVERLQYGSDVRFTTQTSYLAADVPNKTLVEPETVVDPRRNDPAPTVLMMPLGTFAPDPVETSGGETNGVPETDAAAGTPDDAAREGADGT